MFHRGWVLGLLIGFLCNAHATAQEAAPSEVPPATPSALVASSFSHLEWHTLDNGLLVVLDPNPDVSTVTVAIGVDVGQRDAPPGWSGLVHLAEHLLFRAHGSDSPLHRGENQPHFIERLERLGVISCNGMTSRDRTVYFETVPARALDEVLWLEADRLTNVLPNLDLNTLVREREIVHRERALRDDASTLAPQLVHRIFYGRTHPYADALAERAQDLDAIGLPEMQSFLQRAYTPEHLTVAISGSFDASTIMPRITQLFGGLRSTALPIAAPEVAIPVMYGERRLLVDVPRARDALMVIWPTPPFGAREDATLDVLAHTMERRLRERLHDAGHSYLVRARQQSSDLASEFTVYIEVPRHSGTLAPLRAVNSVLSSLQTQRVEDGELARTRSDILRDWLRTFDSPQSRALALVRRPLAFPARRYDPREDVARYEAVDADGMQRTAIRWLRHSARLVVSLDATRSAPYEGVLVRDMIAGVGQ